MDFSGWLLIALLVAIILALINRWYVRPAQIQGHLSANAITFVIAWIASFVPILFVVFVLRAFIAEPYRIPSGSMLPGLKVGDFILVTKYAYGMRIPILNWEALDWGDPKRGDVAVFKYPLDPSLSYVKRLIGLPGDLIEYQQGVMKINEDVVQSEKIAPYHFTDNGMPKTKGEVSKVSLGERSFEIIHQANVHQRPFTIRVPKGHYFVMGDNRDQSSDSRAWGFVPEENFVGKAVWIWFSWGSSDHQGPRWDRIPSRIQ